MSSSQYCEQAETALPSRYPLRWRGRRLGGGDDDLMISARPTVCQIIRIMSTLDLGCELCGKGCGTVRHRVNGDVLQFALTGGAFGLLKGFPRDCSLAGQVIEAGEPI